MNAENKTTAIPKKSPIRKSNSGTKKENVGMTSSDTSKKSPPSTSKSKANNSKVTESTGKDSIAQDRSKRVTLDKTSKTKSSKSKVKKSNSNGKVAAKSDAAKNLRDLYVDGLKDIYWAEKALKKALPKMAKNATSSELKSKINAHLEQTMEHISRLERCFEEAGEKAKGEKCDAMKGLLEEGKGIMEETQPGAVRDAGIIAAAQKVEHYEIATYGTLAAFAKVLGLKKSLKLLVKTLDEEKKCDEQLTALADTALNTKAK